MGCCEDLILASNEFKGIVNPLARVGCKYFSCVYRYRLLGFAWFSYWFDNLVSTEGNTGRY